MTTNPDAAGKGASTQTGMLLYIAAMLLLPVSDAVIKYLAISVNPLEISFWRYCMQGLLLLALMIITRQSFRPQRLPLLLFSGLMSAVTFTSLTMAFSVMPLATAITIFFVVPLLLTVLAALILREPTGWRRYAAVLVGLIGVVIVIRPNFSTFGAAALLPLLAALAFAFNAITLRYVAASVPAVAIQFWASLSAAVAIGATTGIYVAAGGFAPAGFSMEAGQWALIAVAAGTSTLAFLLMSQAFKRVNAATIAPFQYVQIVGSVSLGYIVFGDFPDIFTWIGAAIILGSGLYVFHRERRQKSEPAAVGAQ